jgi:glycosyltransferase involved in cell wall biosynthesis
MITLMAIIVFAFTALQLLLALVNVIFRERMRHGAPGKGLVSVLIPARNEEINIASIMGDVLSQDHDDFELIVCDDQSDDKTAAIVEEYAARDARIRLIRTKELPQGWLGKNHACHTLAQKAKGRYFLFLDADVRIGGDIIGQAIAHAERHGLALISIFPRQIMKSLGEKITVPLMNYILLTLLPLILVRISRRPSLSAANGQFMFFAAAEYKELHPHRVMKNNPVEDIGIARYYKKSGLKISCRAGDSRVSCRMYRGFSEAVQGFSKNVIVFFGGYFIPALLFWAVTTAGIAFIPPGAGWPWFFVCLAMIYSCRALVSIGGRQNIAENMIYLPVQQVVLGIFILQAIRNRMKKEFRWKGRVIRN